MGEDEGGADETKPANEEENTAPMYEGDLGPEYFNQHHKHFSACKVCWNMSYVASTPNSDHRIAEAA